MVYFSNKRILCVPFLFFVRNFSFYVLFLTILSKIYQSLTLVVGHYSASQSKLFRTLLLAIYK